MASCAVTVYSPDGCLAIASYKMYFTRIGAVGGIAVAKAIYCCLVNSYWVAGSTAYPDAVEDEIIAYIVLCVVFDPEDIAVGGKEHFAFVGASSVRDKESIADNDEGNGKGDGDEESGEVDGMGEEGEFHST